MLPPPVAASLRPGPHSSSLSSSSPSSDSPIASQLSVLRSSGSARAPGRAPGRAGRVSSGCQHSLRLTLLASEHHSHQASCTAHLCPTRLLPQPELLLARAKLPLSRIGRYRRRSGLRSVSGQPEAGPGASQPRLSWSSRLRPLPVNRDQPLPTTESASSCQPTQLARRP